MGAGNGSHRPRTHTGCGSVALYDATWRCMSHIVMIGCTEHIRPLHGMGFLARCHLATGIPGGRVWQFASPHHWQCASPHHWQCASPHDSASHIAHSAVGVEAVQEKS